MSRVLITGGAGFVGQWLGRAALERGDTVVLAGFEPPSFDVTLFEDHPDAARWIAADMRSQSHVNAMVDAAEPDIVFHLAGVSFPPDAERDPAGAFDVNTLGVVRLLAALAERRRAGSLDPVTVVVGSAVQYGNHDASEMPLREEAEQRPASVYGASKAAQEIVALQAARANGLRVVCTRSFNHSGPGQAAEYLLPSLVRRVRDLAQGGPAALVLGNDVERDYLHVSDVAAAYLALADRGVSGEVYNVASGIGLRVTQLAADILRRAGAEAEIESDASLARATDIPVLVGSPAKLMTHTGWAPQKTHADIIDDLLRFAHAATD